MIRQITMSLADKLSKTCSNRLVWMIMTNPFPGLRPFEKKDAEFFFGRRTELSEMMRKLQATRFLAVVGSSGVGKSSLIRAGLLPSLERGALIDTPGQWRIAVMRPGQNPIENLASALNEASMGDEFGQFANQRRHEFHVMLQGGGSSLTDVSDCLRLNEQDKLLVVVDQFEELLLFIDDSGKPNSAKRAEAIDIAFTFLELLLHAAHQQEKPIHVLLTMRSEYLGDCSAFPELTSAINDGMYLVPQMSIEQLLNAIEEPIRVARNGTDGGIDSSLVMTLITDALQQGHAVAVLAHCLRRLWYQWEKGGGAGAINHDHYRAIGTLEKEIAQIADRLMREKLTPKQRKLAQDIFRALISIDEDGRKLRSRAKSVAQLAAATAKSEVQLVEVIDEFREDECQFLTVRREQGRSDGKLDGKSEIEITHECLMELWIATTEEGGLRDWAQSEADSDRKIRELDEIHWKILEGFFLFEKAIGQADLKKIVLHAVGMGDRDITEELDELSSRNLLRQEKENVYKCNKAEVKPLLDRWRRDFRLKAFATGECAESPDDVLTRTYVRYFAKFIDERQLPLAIANEAVIRKRTLDFQGIEPWWEDILNAFRHPMTTTAGYDWQLDVPRIAQSLYVYCQWKGRGKDWEQIGKRWRTAARRYFKDDEQYKVALGCLTDNAIERRDERAANAVKRWVSILLSQCFHKLPDDAEKTLREAYYTACRDKVNKRYESYEDAITHLTDALSIVLVEGIDWDINLPRILLSLIECQLSLVRLSESQLSLKWSEDCRLTLIGLLDFILEDEPISEEAREPVSEKTDKPVSEIGKAPAKTIVDRLLDCSVRPGQWRNLILALTYAGELGLAKHNEGDCDGETYLESAEFFFDRAEELVLNDKSPEHPYLKFRIFHGLARTLSKYKYEKDGADNYARKQRILQQSFGFIHEVDASNDLLKIEIKKGIETKTEQDVLKKDLSGNRVALQKALEEAAKNAPSRGENKIRSLVHSTQSQSSVNLSWFLEKPPQNPLRDAIKTASERLVFKPFSMDSAYYRRDIDIDPAELAERRERCKSELGWARTSEPAKKWWNAFEDENKERPSLVLRLLRELQQINSNIQEKTDSVIQGFFQAWLYSNCDNIQANLHFYNCVARSKKIEEDSKSTGNSELSTRLDSFFLSPRNSGLIQSYQLIDYLPDLILEKVRDRQRAALANISDEYVSGHNTLLKLIGDPQTEAQQFWSRLENTHRETPEVLLKVVNELKNLNAGIDEVHKAYNDAEAHPSLKAVDLQIAIDFLAYTQLKNQEAVTKAIKDEMKSKKSTGASDKLKRLKPHSVDAYLQIGNMWEEAGYYREALSAYDDARDLNPRLGREWLKIGNFYCAINRYEEARDAYYESLNTHQKDADTWEALGHLYRYKGEHDKSIAQFKKVVSSVPQWVAGYRGIAMVWQSEEAWHAAEMAFETAFHLSNGGDLASVFIMQRKQGIMHEASREEEAIEKLEKNAYGLACFYANFDDLPRAMMYLKDALRQTSLFQLAWARHDPDLILLRENAQYREQFEELTRFDRQPMPASDSAIT